MAITIHLADDQAEGLTELIYMAQRGREDYLEAVRAEGDYTAADQQANERRWESAQTVIRAISHQAPPGKMPLVDTLATFLDLARDWANGDTWMSTQCTEAEAAAELYRALGQYTAAETLLEAHARGDDDEEDQHHHRYLELRQDKKNS